MIKEKSYPYLIEEIIEKATESILEGNIQKGKRMYMKGEKLAKKRGDKKLLEVFKGEIDILNSQKNFRLPKILNCSFCGLEETDKRIIIKGPGVYICEECVEMCNYKINKQKCLDGEKREKKKRKKERVTH